jgi:hypothetical protein
VRRVALAFALALGAAAPAQAASIQVGVGTNPGVAMDEAGNAVVAWQAGDNFDVQVCVLPAKARACAATTAIPLPSDGYARSRVSVLMPAPNTVDVIDGRNNGTYLARSVDGGRTFAPARKISSTGFVQGVTASDGRVALSGAGAVLSAGVVRSDGSDAGSQGVELGETVDGIYDDSAALGPEVYVASSAAGPAQAYRLPAGGDPNAPDAWQRLPDLAGRQPELTGGPAGLVALLEPVGNTPKGLFVQRLLGANWSAPTAIAAAGATNHDFELAQGATGRLTALWTDGVPYRLTYTTSVDGGALWSSEATVALYSDYPSGLEMATASNGAGIAVVPVGIFDATPIRVVRFTPRTAPTPRRRFGSVTIQARAVCSSIGHFGVVVVAARRGARVSPSVVLRRASFGHIRGAHRTFAQRFRAGYDPSRTNLRVRVLLHPRKGRARTLKLRARRCWTPG